MRNLVVPPVARAAKVAPFNPGFISACTGTLGVRMYCAAFSTLRGWAGFSIDRRSLDPGAMTAKCASASVSAFQTSCGVFGGQPDPLIFVDENPVRADLDVHPALDDEIQVLVGKREERWSAGAGRHPGEDEIAVV